MGHTRGRSGDQSRHAWSFGVELGSSTCRQH
uniref:Uncharacterized protein n=1 Tax=Arundo donax TaxID=35708 RepID=A0A0A9AA77_ARUDO